MNDLFSSLIQRAQGVTPGLRPLHALYRPDATESPVLGEETGPFEYQADIPTPTPRIESNEDEATHHREHERRSGNNLEASEALAVIKTSAVSHAPVSPLSHLSPATCPDDPSVASGPASDATSSTESSPQHPSRLRTDASSVVATTEMPSPRRRLNKTEPEAGSLQLKVVSLLSENEAAQNIRRQESETLIWDKTAAPMSVGRSPILPTTPFEVEPASSNYGSATRPTSVAEGRAFAQAKSRHNQPMRDSSSVIQPEERHVTVSIARLEVRVNSQSTVKIAASSAPAVSTLNEYLRERRGGSR